MSVYINREDNFSDMRGPCSEGYHIPTLGEISTLYSIFISFGWLTEGGSGSIEYTVNSFSNIEQCLLAPSAGDLAQATGNYENRPNLIRFLSCSGSGIRAYSSYISTTQAYLNNIASFGTNKCVGLSIRPFKDIPVAPDSNWTALYSNKVYHNSALGLISLSSDGVNWITISDKNLGATTVFTSGATLSESNCGKLYQWGNNYGFTWGVNASSTSSTGVDASSYGPGNYYNSSTFILATSPDYKWDTSENDNLRGGVTGIVSPAPLKNAYIGEYKRYTPGSNTVAYFPLAEDGLDVMGNYTLSNTGTAQTIGRSFSSQTALNSVPSATRTIMAWTKIVSASSNGGQCGILGIYGSYLAYTNTSSSSINKSFYIYYNGSSYYSTKNIIDNTWHHVAIVNNGSNSLVGYVDGVAYNTGSPSIGNASNNIVYNSSSNTINVVFSELILESKQWTQAELQKYYNDTKANYGL